MIRYKKNVVHITLKYWFIVENEKTKLFDELKELTNKQKIFNVKINDIKTFSDSNQFVIFADINRYKTGDNFVKKFMSILSKYDFVTWKKTDNKINGAVPHSTIAIVKKPENIHPNKIIKLLKTKLKKSRGEVLGIRIRRRPINTKTNERYIYG